MNIDQIENAVKTEIIDFAAQEFIANEDYERATDIQNLIENFINPNKKSPDF